MHARCVIVVNWDTLLDMRRSSIFPRCVGSDGGTVTTHNRNKESFHGGQQQYGVVRTSKSKISKCQCSPYLHICTLPSLEIAPEPTLR